MRIVLVNWASISEGARRGGGVNGYCQSLALELLRRGHEVVSLCGGTRRDAGPAPPPRIEQLARWRGIAIHEVVNSPVRAPSLDQFGQPLGEVSAPALESLIERFAADLRPDLVHFHNIEGFSAGCIPAIRRARPDARILFSLHNYHTICPQVYLLQGHRRPCFSFDNGHACINCIPSPAAAAAPARPALRDQPAPRPCFAKSPPSFLLPALPPRFIPGRGPHPWYGDDVPAWRPLLNVIEPEPPSSKPPTDYAHRRAAMVAMLNSCDAVLAVSSFVARKFASMGVDPARLRTLPIGSRMVDLAVAEPSAPPASLMDGPRLLRPIRLAFMGYNNWYKGLPMLADSLDLLTPEVLSRFHLHIFALEGEQMEPIFRTIEARLGGLTFQHGYRYEEVPRLLAGIDLGVVPSVWWDNGPQTVMEFLACGVPILGAALGGIPDLVRDGENGLLFVGNHRWDLARRLAQIAREPSIIPRLRAGVRPPRTMSRHVDELERLYSGTLS